MRIGIEMSGVQSPSRDRGIGRYVRGLVGGLLGRGPGHSYVFYADPALPLDQIPVAEGARTRLLAPDRARGEATLLDALGPMARANPDHLDVLLIPNPLEMCDSRSLPARPPHGPAFAAVVHDLIPFLFADRYLTDPAYAAAFRRRLMPLRGYDVLLANSEATRADCLSVLGLPGDRVSTILTAGDGDGVGLVPDFSEPMPAATRSTLRRLGIDRPFVMTVGVGDDRKNQRGLIDAFARLPGSLRRSHQLALVGGTSTSVEARVLDQAGPLGIADRVVFTGRVDDAALRLLYQRCAAFVFPSYYEGFGLPILEAMHCGAAVVAGDNSSLVEATGDAGLLVDAGDPAEISAALVRILDDPPFRQALRERAVRHASTFQWSVTAGRALDAFGRVAWRPRATARPRLAVFAPHSGRDRGAAGPIVEALARNYALDVYHEPGDAPLAALRSSRVAGHDGRNFARLDRIAAYRAAVVLDGASRPAVDREGGPGFIVLRDPSFARPDSSEGPVAAEFFDYEGRKRRPPRLEDPDRPGRPGSWSGRTDLGAGLGATDWIVVPSTRFLRLLQTARPELAARAAVIPAIVPPRETTPQRRADARKRLEIGEDVAVLLDVGPIHPSRAPGRVLAAFEALSAARPDCLLIVIGAEVDGGRFRNEVASRGLARRVRFLVDGNAARASDGIAASDLAIQLRESTPDDESSGGLLDILAAGIPAILDRAARVVDVPDGAVACVDAADVAATLVGLAADPGRRAAMGRSAAGHIREWHAPASIAARFAALIEAMGPALGPQTGPGPHFFRSDSDGNRGRLSASRGTGERR